MSVVGTRPPRPARAGLGFAYLMTGTALACILVSGVLGSIFTPALVTTSGTATGYAHRSVPLAAYLGWVVDVVAIWLVLPVAMQGIRAKVTDRAPWSVLGFGVGGVWLAALFVSIFTPAVESGTEPWSTWVPLGSILSVIAGLAVTALLCRMLKTASFEPAVPPPAPAATGPPAAPEPAGEDAVDAEDAGDAEDAEEAGDAVATLRRLARLRDSRVITEAEFEAKKGDLLSRI